MGFPAKHLSEGERVIVSTRTHWKALILPALVLIVTCGIAGFLIAILPGGSAHDGAAWIIVILAAMAIVWFVVRPFLFWLTASYTVTNRRLINRSGVLTRTGTDIPLYRINDVRTQRGLIDRMLGCGTLVISAASELGTTTLPDVPRVEQVHLAIAELLFPEAARRGDEGDPGHHPLEPRPHGQDSSPYDTRPYDDGQR
jgi:membrane protein YdbS with pleckstrin-like domain